MVVTVNGTQVINTYVSSTTVTAYTGTYNNTGAAGRATVIVSFTNDYYNPPADRNLWLQTISVTDGAGNVQGWSVVSGPGSVQNFQGGALTQGCYTFYRYFGAGALQVLSRPTSYQQVAVESARKSFVGPGRLSFKIWVPGNAAGEVTQLQGYAKSSSGSVLATTPAINYSSNNEGQWFESSLFLTSGQTATKVGVSFYTQANYTPDITEVQKTCNVNSDCLVNSCVGGYCSTSIACTGTGIPTGTSLPTLVIDAIQYNYTGT
jgi:hypothetical protein